LLIALRLHACSSSASSARATSGVSYRALLFIFVNFHGFEVFGFKYLETIQTFHVIDAIASGNYLGAGVITSGRHMAALLMKFILNGR